jgi:hypothetical protein
MVANEAEITFSEGVPIVPNVRPVIIVSGTDYEMGYQWFQQYAQIFGLWILQEMQKKLTKQEIGYLEQHQVHVKKYVPEFIDIMRGMAKAANDLGVPLSYAEVMAEFFPPREFPNALPKDKTEALPDECSGFAAWGSTTKDGKLVCLGIPDGRDMKFEHTVMVFPKDKGSNNFIVPPTYKEKRKAHRAWAPLHPGMNNKGLAYVHHGAGINGRERQAWCIADANADDKKPHGEYGVPFCFAVMHTLRYAKNAKEALKMQLSYKGYQAGLWADTSGDGFVLECRDPKTIRRSGDCGEKDFLYATNNVLATGEIEKYLPEGAKYVPHAGWVAPGYGSLVSSITRNLQMWNMFHNYQGKVDLKFAKMVARFAGEPPAYATQEEADALYGSLGKGWNGMIGAPSNAHIGIMLPDNGNEGLFYTCYYRAGRVAYPFGPKSFYYPVDLTYSFYQLKLAEEPVGVLEAAMERARYDLFHADQELMKLSYWDAPYAPLKEIFNKAATEWAKGDYYLDKARKTKGNDAIYQYGKGLRAFTRCQAYANHVYEALVPPPTTPSDLGLGKWFGAWGEWATWKR